MKSKLYLETTIPSYLTSHPSRDLIVAAHQQINHEWWEKRRHDFDIFISQFVIDEAGRGDEEASQRRLKILSEFDLLDITDDVTDLASAILDAGVIPQETALDAAHIAIATVHNIQFLLTWNCTHLANAEISIEIKSVCKSKGYECPIICTPEELMGEN